MITIPTGRAAGAAPGIKKSCYVNDENTFRPQRSRVNRPVRHFDAQSGQPLALPCDMERLLRHCLGSRHPVDDAVYTHRLNIPRLVFLFQLFLECIATYNELYVTKKTKTMNKIKISTIAMLLFVAVMVTGCKVHGKPVKADNSSIEVQKLFTVDGVTVYRFTDNGRLVYFTNGNGVAQYKYSTLAGKVCVTKDVVTLCNNKGRGQER